MITYQGFNIILTESGYAAIGEVEGMPVTFEASTLEEVCKMINEALGIEDIELVNKFLDE